MVERKKIISLLILFMLLIGILLVILLSRQQQDIRQRADVGDDITFKVNPTTPPPGQTTFPVTLILEGKGNDISYLDITISSSDVSKLSIHSFTPNNSFTQIINTANGTSLHYVGLNATTTPIVGAVGINEITLGTIELEILGAGGGSLTINPLSQITRTGGGSTLLGITNGATPLATYTLPTTTISSSPIPTATPTQTPVPSTTPTSSPTPTPTPTGTPPTVTITSVVSPSPTPTNSPVATPPTCAIRPACIDEYPQACQIAEPTQGWCPPGIFTTFTLTLQGIGSGILENSEPLHKQKQLTITVFDRNNAPTRINPASPINITMYYNETTKQYIARTTAFGAILPTGNYIFKVKTPGYLTRRIPGFVVLNEQTRSINLPATKLIPGDINSDNALNIIDYTMYRNCYGKTPQDTVISQEEAGPRAKPLSCELADLNDDGKLDNRGSERDYLLLISSFSIRTGD